MRKKNITTDMMKSYITESLFLLMEKKPYGAISIGEITQKAGVNRSTYYRNFSSKENIVRFFLDGLMKQYSDAYKISEEHSIEVYLQILFSCFYDHKEELLLLNRNRLSHMLLNTFNDWLNKPRRMSPDFTQEQHRIAYHVGGIYNSMILWISHGMAESPAEMTQISMSILPKGFQPLLLEIIRFNKEDKNQL